MMSQSGFAILPQVTTALKLLGHSSLAKSAGQLESAACLIGSQDKEVLSEWTGAQMDHMDLLYEESSPNVQYTHRHTRCVMWPTDKRAQPCYQSNRSLSFECVLACKECGLISSTVIWEYLRISAQVCENARFHQQLLCSYLRAPSLTANRTWAKTHMHLYPLPYFHPLFHSRRCNTFPLSLSPPTHSLAPTQHTAIYNTAYYFQLVSF